MKKIFALILGLSFCCCEVGLANEEQPTQSKQYGYVDLGFGPAPLPIPQFGGGYRAQYGSNGFDINGQLSTVYWLTTIKLGVDYLHYINPDINKEFYIGAGPAIVGVFQNDHNRGGSMALAPELIFGKQYLSDTGSPRHFQANLMWPTFFMHQTHHSTKEDMIWYPMVSFSYGWGF